VYSTVQYSTEQNSTDSTSTVRTIRWWGAGAYQGGGVQTAPVLYVPYDGGERVAPETRRPKDVVSRSAQFEYTRDT
jgi:hypothetical protein